MTTNRTSDRIVTTRQRDILIVIDHNGPIAPSEVARHLPGWRSVEAYRAACSRLEARRLLAADYTSTEGRARAYVITERGQQMLARFDNAR